MRHRFWILLILLVAAGFRLYGIATISPPGLAHDEVANWLIDQSILAGNHAVYFTEAYGHEAGFHYIQAGFVALLGDHVLALRAPAGFIGLLGLAINYTLTRRLFNHRTALIATALSAVLFWPIFYSRLGLRAILLPLTSALSAYFFIQGLGIGEQGAVFSNQYSVISQPNSQWPTASGQQPAANSQRPTATPHFLLAGFFAGLSLHTYMAGRTVPIFYLFFCGYLLLFHRDLFKRQWRGIVLFWVVMGLVSAPLTYFLLTNPGSEFRISEIDLPLQALRQGDLQPVLENTVKILGMFGFQGDSLWRQNVASRPVFDPLLATLYYLGLALAFWRWRDTRYAFVVLWTVTAFIPSVVTIDAPSSIRIINILPALTMAPAIVMHNLTQLSTVKSKLSTAKRVNLGIVALTTIFFTFHFLRTHDMVFRLWPQNAEVEFVWQKALTEAAHYLDETPTITDVAIGGWTPDTMDPPTMALSLRRDDLNIRYFHPERALVLPAGTNPLIIHPAILPLSVTSNQFSVTSDQSPVSSHHFASVHATRNTQYATRYTFGNELHFLGYEQIAPNQIVTHWRVAEPTGEPRRIFLHALNEAGDAVVFGDGLDAPAGYWQPNDILLQLHTFSLENLDNHTLRLGVYNPTTNVRLPTDEGTDFIELND